MNKPSICAVASDAGGYKAIAPVIALAHARGLKTSLLLTGPAAQLHPATYPEIPFKSCEDSLTHTECVCQLEAINPSVLLSACGLYNELEYNVRSAAHSISIPIVGVLDAWHNYRERFTRHDRPTLFPDHLCVIDETSHQGMVNAGMSSDKIHLTGHPDLEATTHKIVEMGASWKTEVRKSLSLTPSDKLYIFLSDPFIFKNSKKPYLGPGAIMNDDGTPKYGYTTASILPQLVKCLLNANGQRQQCTTLVLRPHPSEWAEPLYQIAAELSTPQLKIIVSEDRDTLEWIATADAVFGMMSIALLHAALAKKLTTSIQIGLTESGIPDPCIASCLGYTHTFLDIEKLQTFCHDLYMQSETLTLARPEYPIAIQGSIVKILHILESTSLIG